MSGARRRVSNENKRVVPAWFATNGLLDNEGAGLNCKQTSGTLGLLVVGP